MATKLIVALLTGVFLLGCTDPRIDTSSDPAMKSSIEKARQSLPQDRRAQFDEALKVLAFSEIDMGDFLGGGAEAKMKAAVNGKTALEVIAEADRLRIERRKKERAQALAEIEELEKKKASAEMARKQLVKFRVLRSRYYKQKREFLSAQPIIELTVENGTQNAISRVHFKGTLASPNRSVPWLQKDFNYRIAGGLEPGEKATWKLAPNPFSEWGSVDAPPDAVLTVTVERVDGPDGKSLFSTSEFSEKNAERLQMLREKYGGSG